MNGEATAVLITTGAALADAIVPKGSTPFSQLSAAAQDLIVRAAMGEFDNTPPPAIPASVQAEIRAWANEAEGPQ